MSQTIGNIEYIFVNDASTDSSLKVLHNYFKDIRDDVIIIDSKDNLCQGGARNLGLAIAKGRYISFVDSDDFVSNRMLETLLEKAESSNADMTVIQAASVPEDYSIECVKQDSIKPYVIWDETILSCQGHQLSDSEREKILCYPIGGIWSVLWKRELLEKANLSFPVKLRYEDNYWGSIVKCYVSLIAFIPEIHYFYRNRHDSTVHSVHAKHQMDRIQIEHALIDETKKRNLYDRYITAWEYIFTFRYVFNTINYLIQYYSNDLLIENMVKELRTTYPNWNRNPYYKRLKNGKSKIREITLVYATPVYLFLYHKLKALLKR